MKRKCKVASVVPTPDTIIRKRTALAMQGLFYHTGKFHKNVEIYTLEQVGAHLPRLRTRAVNSAQPSSPHYMKLQLQDGTMFYPTAKTTHIFMVDGDMTFPQNALVRLLGHKKLVVGCNCVTKLPPYKPTCMDLNYNTIIRPQNGRKIDQVYSLGNAFVLIDMRVFDRIPMPFYMNEYSRRTDHFYAEDRYFFQLCEENDIPVFCDFELSREIRHWGEQGFSIDDSQFDDTAPQKNVNLVPAGKTKEVARYTKKGGGEFKYKCPRCSGDLFGDIGDPAYCEKCNITIETGWDQDSSQELYAWLKLDRIHDGDVRVA